MNGYLGPVLNAAPPLIRPQNPMSMSDDMLIQLSQWQRQALINSLQKAQAQQQGQAFGR